MTRINHEIYMHRCLQLAQLGMGNVAPNPLVGAVLVYEDKIIGEGYHQQFGKAHAEVNAINNCDPNLLEKATLYVNLEPCAHFGKTPPCVDLILEKKIKKVVIGCLDPYEKVAGRGVEKLKSNGVEVLIDVCKHESINLNKRFFTFVLKKRPYIILKYAQTADGFIGRNQGDDHTNSKQISNDISIRLTHQWRSEESAILVGTNTAVEDNPKLNTRYGFKNPPIRITIDQNLRIPATHHFFDGTQRTIIFTSLKSPKEISNLEYQQIDFSSPNFLTEILQQLLERGIQSVLIEGGTKTLQAFIDSGLWDEARIFTSTKTWGTGIKAPVHNSSFFQLESYSIVDDTLTIFKNTDSI